MALFGKKNKAQTFLGIDIGAGGIKIVELSNEKGRAKLMTYGYSRRGFTDVGKSLLDQPEAAAKLLTQITKKAGTKTLRAISGLPQHVVFHSVVAVPKVKDKNQMKALIEGEIKQLTPIPLNEMIIDSKFIDEEKATQEEQKKSKDKKTEKDKKEEKIQKGETTRVLVTGAAKNLVQKYVRIFKLAKLELLSLETESFALVRSLVGRDKSVIMIIDIGTVKTNISIIEKGIPFLTRSVNIGGSMVTKQISEQMDMSIEQAEQMKLDLAKSSDNGTLPVVELTLQPILNEINYSIGEFKRQKVTDNQLVEKIIITGGSAHLPGIAPYLSQKLSINTYIGDPWARVAVPEPLRPVLDEIGPGFAVPIGLAMRDIE